jgi:hypothetical protein
VDIGEGVGTDEKFDVLTSVCIKSSVFWDAAQGVLYRRCGRNCVLRFQGTILIA